MTKKKTRDLPNLTECHCCHLRVDLAKSKSNKLHLLYSEWRIVLLCKKCLSRVESTELCSYCFRHSSSGDCFSCRQCKRRVHRDCDSEYRSSAVWSGSSSVAAAEEVSVCGDCWVSESLARWRRSRNSSGGAGRKNRADLGVGRARVSDDERKCDSDSVVVCDYSSTEEVRCLRLDAVEEEEEEEEEEEAEENVDDDDGQLKEGQGSCSNGVESESPLCSKVDCNCVARAKGENGDAKLDPYYFKYRRRRIDHEVLTYKRRSMCKSLRNFECPLLTYKRRGSVDARFMFTYKRRRNFDQSMLTYSRRRPEILYASSKIQLEGQC